MKVIILAAGKGQRLYPLTKKVPKCMVKLFGKSMLEWQIKTIHSCGIEKIIVITGYYSEKVTLPGIDVIRNEKFDSTNMVETLFCAKPELDGSVIVSYGDIIYQKDVLKKLIESDEDISVIVDKNWKPYWEIRFNSILEDAESLAIKDGYIVDIGQNVSNIEQIQGQYIGLMKFQKNGIEYLKSAYEYAKSKSTDSFNPLNPKLSFENSYMTDILQFLVKSGHKIKAIPIQNGWLELDSIKDYETYNELKDKNMLDSFISLNKLL